ncbi:MAG: hypothetical protein J0H68_09525 [Sphingobacteriia bacterium]|nr:hypothetical protein [Sphingobacteriia bacterium]
MKIKKIIQSIILTIIISLNAISITNAYTNDSKFDELNFIKHSKKQPNLLDRINNFLDSALLISLLLIILLVCIYVLYISLPRNQFIFSTIFLSIGFIIYILTFL